MNSYNAFSLNRVTLSHAKMGPDQKSSLLLIKRREFKILKQFGSKQCFLQVRFMRTITSTGNLNSKNSLALHSNHSPFLLFPDSTKAKSA